MLPNNDDDLTTLVLACLPDLAPHQAMALGHEIGLPAWLSLRSNGGAAPGAYPPVPDDARGPAPDDARGPVPDESRPPRPVRGRRWLDSEIAFLENNAGCMELDAIAAALGRSKNSIKIRMLRRDMKVRARRVDAGVYNARQAAWLLGLHCSKTISCWIRLGFLQATVAGDDPSRPIYRVTRQALLDVVAQPVAAIALDAGRIRDLELRTAFLRAAHPAYLTCSQASDRLGISQKTLSTLVNSGQVPAIRYGNWFFREDHLPLIDRTLAGRRCTSYGGPVRRYTAEEKGFIVDGLALGYNSAEIGPLAGRSPHSIECLLDQPTFDPLAIAASRGFPTRPRQHRRSPALLGLPAACPAYPILAALDNLRRGTPGPADWPHLRVWLRAWLLFWLDDLPAYLPGALLPRDPQDCALLPDLALAAHHLRYRVPKRLTVEQAVSNAIFLLQSVGLDPVAGCWDARWEPCRLAGQPIPLDALDCKEGDALRPRPIDDAPARVFLADIVAQNLAAQRRLLT